MLTWEQQSRANELVSEAEPFTPGRWVNKTIYREMPWASTAGQLWRTGEALKTLT